MRSPVFSSAVVFSGLLVGLAVSSAPARADGAEAGARKALSERAAELGFGKAVQGVSAFGAVPGISGATFNVDGTGAAGDTELHRINFPLSHEFDGVKAGDASLYAELALGYLKATTDYDNLLGTTDVDSKITSLSAVGGLGFAIPMGENWKLTPMALLGWSRTEDDSGFSGKGAGVLDDATRGILFNFRADDLLYGAAVKLDYTTKLGGDIDVAANVRYNQLFTDTLSSTDSSLEASGNLGILTGFLQLDGPTPLTVFHRDIRWIGFTAVSSFYQDAPDGIGFDYFVELGGGIEVVDKDVIQGIEGLSWRSSVIVGDNGLTGWSTGVQFEF